MEKPIHAPPVNHYTHVTLSMVTTAQEFEHVVQMIAETKPMFCAFNMDNA
jgi:hypothetical protein